MLLPVGRSGFIAGDEFGFCYQPLQGFCTQNSFSYCVLPTGHQCLSGLFCLRFSPGVCYLPEALYFHAGCFVVQVFLIIKKTGKTWQV